LTWAARSYAPAKVIAGLGANAQTYPAGKDGGSLACFTASGSEPGTVCVWVTTTTVGIAEFFSSVGPETMTIQSKAAAGTVKLRDSVERASTRRLAGIRRLTWCDNT
jgi:hypothetical protein